MSFSIKDISPVEAIVLFGTFLYPLAIIATPLSLGASAVLAVMGLGILITQRPAFSRWEKHWLYAAGALLGYILLLMLWTENSYHTWHEFGAFFRLLLVFPLYFLFKHYRRHLPAVLIAVLILAGPLLLLSQNETRGSINMNYMHYGFLSATICTLALTLGLYLQQTARWQNVLLILTTILALIVTIKSGSRGALAGIFLVFLLLFVTLIIQKRYRTLVSLLAGGIVFSLLALWAAPPIVKTRLATIPSKIQNFITQYKQSPNQEEYSSTAYRLKQWELSLKLWQEKPLFGYGLGNFPDAFLSQLKVDKPKMISAKKYHRDPHSIYFFLLVSIGLVGTMLTLWAWFVAPFLLALNAPPDPTTLAYRYASLGLVALFVGFGFTEAWVLRSLVGVYLFFTVLTLALIYPKTRNCFTPK